jgi:hypothetical protein
VCRDPVTAAAQSSGWHYRDVRALQPGASIAPLARPDVLVEVAALLPPAGSSLR